MRLKLVVVLMMLSMVFNVLSANRLVKLEEPEYIGGSFNDIAVVVNYSYIATDNGVKVINNSDPANPVVINNYYTKDKVNSLVINGSYVYLAVNDEGIKILNISNVNDIKLEGSLNITGSALDIKISGQYLYVADDNKALSIINILDPQKPVLAGELEDVPGTTRSVFISGNYAYIANERSDNNTNFFVIDISNPKLPQKNGYVQLDGRVQEIAVSGNHAYASTEEGELHTIDLSDQSSPRYLRSLITEGFTKGISISGNYLYTVCGLSGLKVVDISAPNIPSIVTSLNISGNSWDLVTSGQKLYIANKGSGLSTVDISDPMTPIILGGLSSLGSTRSTIIKDNIAYVADGDYGVKLIDINDISNPVFLSDINLSSFAYDLYLKDNNIFVATGTGVSIVEVNNDNSLTLLTHIATDSISRGVVVDNDKIYIAADESGLLVVEINATDITNSQVINQYDTYEGRAYGLAYENGIVYLAYYDDGLNIIDVSDPANLTFRGRYKLNSASWNVVVEGGVAYVADGPNGLKVIDVSDVESPILLGSHKVDNIAVDVKVKDGFAYIADLNKGLYAVNIENYNNMNEAAKYNTSGGSYGVTINGDNIFLSDGFAGLKVFKSTGLTLAQSFVYKLYKNILDRESDMPGLEYWDGLLNSGVTATIVSKEFFFSQEFKNANLSDEEFLNRIYTTLLNRLPDDEGKNYWIDQMQNQGVLREQVFYFFVFSDEFNNICNLYGIINYNQMDQLLAFIERFYNVGLSRPSDLEGLNFWSQELDAKNRSAKQIAREFFLSNEFKNKSLNNKDFLITIYRTLLNRIPDENGEEYWVKELNNGMVREVLIDNFIASPEFEELTHKYGIRAE